MAPRIAALFGYQLYWSFVRGLWGWLWRRSNLWYWYWAHTWAPANAPANDNHWPLCSRTFWTSASVILLMWVESGKLLECSNQRFPMEPHISGFLPNTLSPTWWDVYLFNLYISMVEWGMFVWRNQEYLKDGSHVDILIAACLTARWSQRYRNGRRPFGQKAN